MPALAQLYPYKAGPIEPIVMPGETVGVWVNKLFLFYKVDYTEPIKRSDPVEINLGALAAGAASAITQLALLQMPDLEFGQFRAEVLDDCAMVMYQGRADQRNKLFTRVANMNRFTAIHDPCGHESEFYVYEDQFAFLQATNQTGYALTQSRAVFWGFRYVLSDTDTKKFDWKAGRLPDQWTRVPATAHL